MMALIPGADIFGQSGLSPRSIGMGGAYSTLAEGAEAPFWNPANLGLRGQRSAYINLFSLTLGIRNNSFSSGQYEKYNGKFLTPSDKKALIESIPEDGFKLLLSSNIRPLGLSVPPFALVTDTHVGSDLVLARDYFDLFFNGNEPDRVYRFDGTGGEAWAYASICFSVGYRVPAPFFDQLSAGLSYRYILGVGFAEVAKSQGSFVTDIEGARADGEVLLRYAMNRDGPFAGKGFAFDLGFAGVKEGWRVGLSFINLINSIRWGKEVKEYELSFRTLKPLTVASSNVDSLIDSSDSEREVTGLRRRLPVIMNLGASRRFGMFLVAMDYQQGFGEVAEISRRPRFALGVEFSGLKILPLRSGLSLGGETGAGSSAGFGLRLYPLNIDLGVDFPGKIWPFDSKGISISMAVGMAF